jgi:hypothetical protein
MTQEYRKKVGPILMASSLPPNPVRLPQSTHDLGGQVRRSVPAIEGETTKAKMAQVLKVAASASPSSTPSATKAQQTGAHRPVIASPPTQVVPPATQVYPKKQAFSVQSPVSATTKTAATSVPVQEAATQVYQKRGTPPSASDELADQVEIVMDLVDP